MPDTNQVPTLGLVRELRLENYSTADGDTVPRRDTRVIRQL